MSLMFDENGNFLAPQYLDDIYYDVEQQEPDIDIGIEEIPISSEYYTRVLSTGSNILHRDLVLHISEEEALINNKSDMIKLVSRCNLSVNVSGGKILEVVAYSVIPTYVVKIACGFGNSKDAFYKKNNVTLSGGEEHNFRLKRYNGNNHRGRKTPAQTGEIDSRTIILNFILTDEQSRSQVYISTSCILLAGDGHQQVKGRETNERRIKARKIMKKERYSLK